MRGMNKNKPLNFSGLGDWFPVFKSGEQTDSRGRKNTFTEQDLDSIVANHSADDPAPLVVGHPKTNHPAYGWTEALKREGNTLYAKATDVVTEFEQAVKNKLYRKRSISIVPTDDGYRLRHIGFLGAAAPAVEGLKDIAFSDNNNALEFEMSDEQRWGTTQGLNAISRALRNLRDWLIDDRGLESADKVITQWDIESIEDAARSISNSQSETQSLYTADVATEHKEKNPTGEQAVPKEFTQEDVDAAVNEAVADAEKNAKKEAQKKIDALMFSAKVDAAKLTISDLVGEGKLLPAQTPGLAEFIASLPDDDDQSFEYASGNNETKKQTPHEFMTGFIKHMGKQIQLGESSELPPDDNNEHDSDFAAPAGAVVSQERQELHKKALDYQAQHNCDYITAVLAVEGN